MFIVTDYAALNRFDKISAMTENSHKITQHAECELRVANQNIFLRFQMLAYYSIRL